MRRKVTEIIYDVKPRSGSDREMTFESVEELKGRLSKLYEDVDYIRDAYEEKEREFYKASDELTNLSEELTDIEETIEHLEAKVEKLETLVSYEMKTQGR